MDLLGLLWNFLLNFRRFFMNMLMRMSWWCNWSFTCLDVSHIMMNLVTRFDVCFFLYFFDHFWIQTSFSTYLINNSWFHWSFFSFFISKLLLFFSFFCSFFFSVNNILLSLLLLSFPFFISLPYLGQSFFLLLLF